MSFDHTKYTKPLDVELRPSTFLPIEEGEDGTFYRGVVAVDPKKAIRKHAEQIAQLDAQIARLEHQRRIHAAEGEKIEALL